MAATRYVRGRCRAMQGPSTREVGGVRAHSCRSVSPPPLAKRRSVCAYGAWPFFGDCTVESLLSIGVPSRPTPSAIQLDGNVRYRAVLVPAESGKERRTCHVGYTK